MDLPLVRTSGSSGRPPVVGRRGAAAASRAAVVVVAVAAAIGASASTAGPAAAATNETVVVTDSACAPGWSLPASGTVSLGVDNETSVTVDAELIDKANGGIVAALKELGPRTTLPLDARLRHGSYRLQCIYDHRHSAGPPFVHRLSDVATVTGGVPPSSATPAVVPTTAAEMAGPVAEYDKYVAGQITVLQSEVSALTADITSGDVTQAKADWLATELTFSGIGGTYGAVGGLENDINGLPGGFAGGAASQQFLGLHKIEYLLWSGQPASAIEPYVNDLADSVSRLQTLWSGGVMTPNQLSTRAHEVLEDALRDTLSGDDDEGANASLATVAADVQGDQVILGDLRPVIDRRTPKLLPAAESEIDVLDGALNATMVGGQWPALASITSTQTERIDGAVGQVLETLSAVPDLLEVQQFTNGIGG
jgi:high-affinity iron transporter